MLLVGLMLITTSGLIAQDSTFFANNYTKGMALLRKAQQYNDIEMEKKALFELLVLNESDTTMLQGLASMYYNTGEFTSSVMVGMDYLQRYPGDVFALEICALSYVQLRIYDKAIQYYQDLYLRNLNINILYQISFLQFSIKRYDEALVNIRVLEAKAPTAGDLELSRSNNQVQKVPFIAAVHNLKGLIASDQGNKDQAISYFNEALKIAPDFEAAKLSLAELNK